MSAMSRSASGMPRQGPEGSRKPSLSPEARRAYNQMRDVEEEWKRHGNIREALRQRERGRQDVTGHSPYLEIPTTYRRPRSRAGSVSSTGPASTQGSDGGVEDSVRRKRGHRTHALDEPQRLRTAFVRKYVGACKECRQRKVKCTDFDSTELEANYQATKQARLSVASSRSPTLQFPMSPSVPYSPVQAPNELRGVGGHTFGFPHQPINNVHEHLPDDIELDSPTLVNSAKGHLPLPGQAEPTSINPAYSPSNSSPFECDDFYTRFPGSYPVSPMLSSPPSSVGDVEKPLGLLTNELMWECKRGAIDPWSMMSTDSSSYRCVARFQNSILFLEHYRTHHEPFINEKIVLRCRCCGFFPEPYVQSCTKCANEACGHCNASWPLASWYYGTMISPAPSLMSGTSTIPTGQGFGNRLLGPPSPFIGSNSYGSNSQGFGTYGSYGSSYAGSTSNQTFVASPSQPDAFFNHQAPPKHAFTRPPHDENPTSTTTTKEEGPPSTKPPLGEDHHHHHLPKMSSSSFPKCTPSPTTTFSLIINSAKKSLNFNLPCLALAHYLILLLLLFFPFGSSDADNTNTSTFASSFVLDTLWTRGYYHMPLVSVLSIAVGVAGMWAFRCGGDVVGEVSGEAEFFAAGEEGRRGLPMGLIA